MLDASALDPGQTFTIAGVDGLLAGGSLRRLMLPAGTYTLRLSGQPSEIGAFTVERDGNIDYSPLLEGTFSGAHTSTLVLHAYPITIDGSALSERQLKLPGVIDSFASTSPQPLSLVPGRYALQGAEGGAIGEFTVTPTGTLDYDGALDGSFIGQGMSTLTLHAFHVVLDARKLPAQILAVVGVGSSFASDTPQTLELVPGS